MTTETTGEKAATLLLQTEPADARVLLGDRVLGSTPLVSRELPPGLHQLTIKKDGFAPRTLRVYRTKNGTVNLGTIPLARQDTLITIWRVGSPHDGDTPPARIPSDLVALIAASGFRVRTQSFAATAFPGEFVKALQKDGGAGLPDVVAGNNFLPFQELQRTRPFEELQRWLVRASGVLTMIGDFAFLFTRSPGHAAARQIATTNQGMSERFSWSLDELGWKDLPGQMQSQDDDCLLEDLNRQAVSAYLGRRMGEILPLLHKDMLGRQRDFAATAVSGTHWGNRAVHEDIRTLYTLGNDKLAFVLATASFWNEQPQEWDGCREILSVWVKAEDRWSLLTITYDPVSIEATREDIPRLAGSLTEGKGEALWPAGVQVPMTAVPYPTHAGERFGSFRWAPSSSKNVVAEVAEFHFDYGSRLFINPGGEVSDGELWGGGPKSWRVWLVGKDGQIVTSESWEERQRGRRSGQRGTCYPDPVAQSSAAGKRRRGETCSFPRPLLHSLGHGACLGTEACVVAFVAEALQRITSSQTPRCQRKWSVRLQVPARTSAVLPGQRVPVISA